MKIMIAVAIVVVLAGTAIGQTQTTTTCNINGNTANCNSTSVDNGAAVAERNRENAAAGDQMGQALGAGMYRLTHRQPSEEKQESKRRAKAAKKWCSLMGFPETVNPYNNKKCK